MTPTFPFALGLALVACSAGPAPLSRSEHDASNPRAAEGVPWLASFDAAAPVAAGPSHGDHDHESSATYTCPMHPQVTSDKPGRCPQCGMDLVKK